jgi:TRAP-type mannitol/chloroaromatic compound transport system permease small subunit
MLTLMICWEVFSRYVLNTPHAWVFDAQIMLYGTLFMMAGAYTLAKNGHVRGDVLYGFFMAAHAGHARPDPVHRVLPARRLALTWAGWSYARSRWRSTSIHLLGRRPPIYPFKFGHPAGRRVLLLQGWSRSCAASSACSGQWPSREEDVEEVDVDKLKAMVPRPTMRPTSRDDRRSPGGV